MIKVSTTGMAVSLKTDLRFPESGQHGHGSRIIQLYFLFSYFAQDFTPICQAHDKKINHLQKQKTKTTTGDSFSFYFCLFYLCEISIVKYQLMSIKFFSITWK